MAKEMSALNPTGKTVLDPCVGKEELLGYFHRQGKAIHGIDIIDYGVHEKASFERQDFFQLYRRSIEAAMLTVKPELEYDYYIANPPYNCHESDYIRDNKSALQKLFGPIGVANMYSMYISALIDLAKPGSVIGIITGDSFLNNRIHQPLREKILDNCRITHLVLCPVELFRDQKADVRTCIMIMVKGKSSEDYWLATLNRPASTRQFEISLQTRSLDKHRLSSMILDSSKDCKEIVVGCPPDVLGLFSNPRIGELFKCITGISTGSDTKYLSKRHTPEFNVPFYKNPGSRRFYTEPDAYLCTDFLGISYNVSNFIVRNKQLLFKPGVVCSSMGIPFGACVLPEGATFGVNASIFCEERDRYWLLAYLNSSLVTFFVRGIMLRTNMITSGYVSRIPVIPLSNGGKEQLARISLDAIKNKIGKSLYSEAIDSIDNVVFGQAQLTLETEEIVRKFSSHLMTST